MRMIGWLPCLLVLALPCTAAAGDVYYVTQSGAGVRDGKSLGNAWSVANFNSPANWSATEDFHKIGPGDTVYFSGTVTSTLTPAGSGSAAAGYITLDGLAAGDYDALGEGQAGQAVIDLNEYVGVFGFELYKTAYGAGGGKDYLIIQDFEIKEVGVGVYLRDDCDHIIVRRNFIHDAVSNAVYAHSSNHLTIEGNSLKNLGVGTGHADITLGSTTHDVVIRGNHIYATKANGDASDRGIDGIVPVGRVYNVLIEYNSIHGHMDDFDGPHPELGCTASGCQGRGEDGIDIKDDNGGVGNGCHNIIIRYNHIYDNRQSNIHPQTQSHHIYIYGNRTHDSNWGGVFIKEGSCRADGVDGCEEQVQYIYTFSNIIYDERDNGSQCIAYGGGTSEKPHHIYWFNNTFAGNGIDNHNENLTNLTIYDVDPGSTFVKNNIFLRSRPGYPTLQERQLYVKDNVTAINSNLYFWPGKTSTTSINGVTANAVGGHVGIDEVGKSYDTDPGLVDADGHDFRAAGGASAVVGTGEDLGNGAIVTVTIQGVKHPVYWDVALGPGTDWSGIIPVIEEVRRDSAGAWDIGAYQYRPPSSDGGLARDSGPDDGGADDASATGDTSVVGRQHTSGCDCSFVNGSAVSPIGLVLLVGVGLAMLRRGRGRSALKPYPTGRQPHDRRRRRCRAGSGSRT